MRIGPHQTRYGHVSYQTPAWVLFKARVCSALGPWDLTMGGPDPIRGGGGSGPTADALEYITFSGHVAASDPPMWWSRALLWT
jgi:hypothetical protein